MKIKLIALLCLIVVAFQHSAKAHCQVPCGIYDDEQRIDMLLEHQQTMLKARNQIVKLGKKNSAQNNNQLVRWVMTKEDHASEIQDVVSQYFLTQKIKQSLKKKKRQKLLLLAHDILVLAMKCKQSLKESVYKELEQSIINFSKEINLLHK